MMSRVVLLFGLLAHAGALSVKSDQNNPKIQKYPIDELFEDGNKFCIDDMCVDEHLPDVYEEDLNAFPIEALTENATKSKKAPSNHRTLLVEAIHAFHGSTAIQSLLMSTPQVATLCKANTWQCEGATIMTLLQGGHNLRAQDWNWGQALNVFSEIWDLDKHYLLQKDPWSPGAFWVEQSPVWSHPDEPFEAYEKITAAAAGPLPLKMHQAGITHLDVEYLMMWRPICAAKLSHNFGKREVVPGNAYAGSYQLDKKDHRMREDEEFELKKLEQMVEFHKFLKSKGTTVHAISFTDLLWFPSHTAKRLQKDLPNVGKINEYYVPELMKDVYPGNKWKVKGSIAEFGKKVHPNTINYSVKDRSCTEGTAGFVHLPESFNDRITAATSYMKHVSE